MPTLSINTTCTGKELIRTYGGHSPPSQSVSESYDATGRIFGPDGNEATPLWLCGHFTAKAFAAMTEELTRAAASAGGEETTLRCPPVNPRT